MKSYHDGLGQRREEGLLGSASLAPELFGLEDRLLRLGQFLGRAETRHRGAELADGALHCCLHDDAGRVAGGVRGRRVDLEHRGWAFHRHVVLGTVGVAGVVGGLCSR